MGIAIALVTAGFEPIFGAGCAFSPGAQITTSQRDLAKANPATNAKLGLFQPITFLRCSLVLPTPAIAAGWIRTD